MKIMKASAGSGKTYNLSKTYIELLLGSGDPYAYRHILAVTFTNKATAEMKSRILRDLSVKAGDDGRARVVLKNILHNYGEFSVSTIDKFFQQALKAFSREIGQFADYQIELDKDSLIQESMDRILDSLTENDTQLLSWIKSTMYAAMEQGERINIDQSLYDMGAMLKSEEHRELEISWGRDDLSRERLESVGRSCRKIIADFTDKAKGFGLEARRSEMIRRPGVKAMKADESMREFFDSQYRDYCTAFMIDELLFSLGLAGEFYKEFDELLKEKNVMCLDDSNSILKDIIDGSDAPFVYEKLGVRYENFLLDEFQDTSNIQWNNFMPLLKESEAGGGSNLIVGDVKQSIYRFRDSDWTLLGKQVVNEFPAADVQTLDGNWRSTRRIVEFNNGFFSKISADLNLSDIYSDVRQEVRSRDEQEGYVEVTFNDDQVSEVLASIARALEWGAHYSDIAILVRNRKDGAAIAMEIIQKGYPVISDDSLRLKSSVVVRRLVSLLGGIDNPDDNVNEFLTSSLKVQIPSVFHSLVDLCEDLLRSLYVYDPKSFEGETLFIQAFMDDLQSWTDVNGNDLRYYLKHWEESDPFIGSPENAESIRVLTIHKSKGLEFPYLIFPYADNVNLYKHGTHWCHFDSAGTVFPDEVSGLYPVDLTSATDSSYFSQAYQNEREMQLVDNINIFYVALTRAARCLHIISKSPSKKCRESVQKGKPDFGNFSEMLYGYTGGYDRISYGSPYDFSKMGRDEIHVSDFKASYPSFSLGGRLAPSADASDFFADDGKTGPAASSRLRGIILHDILSKVFTPEDLESAVMSSVRDGSLAESESREALSLLRSRISAHPDWFPSAGAGRAVSNEVSIFGPDGSENRPDRVLFDGNSVTIIDFKFGKENENKYIAQVGRYASLYRRLGYRVVSGVIWYVFEDECNYI